MHETHWKKGTPTALSRMPSSSGAENACVMFDVNNFAVFTEKSACEPSEAVPSPLPENWRFLRGSLALIWTVALGGRWLKGAVTRGSPSTSPVPSWLDREKNEKKRGKFVKATFPQRKDVIESILRIGNHYRYSWSSGVSISRLTPPKKEMSLCLDIFLKRNATKSTQNIYPCRLTWNVIMEVWKIIFLFKWVICRFQPLIFQGVLKKTWSSTPTSVLCRQLPMPGQSSPSASSIPFDGLKLKSASSWLCAAAVIYACTDYGRN